MWANQEPVKAMSYTNDDLQACVAALKRGGVVVYPTDTIWGVGCDATNSEAIDRVYALKNRPAKKPMNVLIDSKQRLKDYVQSFDDLNIPEEVYNADAKVTIIYPNACNISETITGEDGSIGIRITDEAFSKALCRELGKPIVSTSANLSGCPSPSFFHEIAKEVIDGADYVVKYRRDDVTPCAPSAIVKIETDGSLVVIRPTSGLSESLTDKLQIRK